MTRRHYGIRVPKPRPTYTGPARAGAWSGSAFISVIVVILIVLGVILHGLSKTITDTAQPRDDSACPGEPSFIIRRVWRIVTIAHRFKRHIDLAECGLSHGCIPPPFGDKHQRN